MGPYLNLHEAPNLAVWSFCNLHLLTLSLMDLRTMRHDIALN